jgi:actin beta/gamma 1
MSAAPPPDASSRCVVIDAGSLFTKAGFSGEDHPQSVIRTVVGTQTKSAYGGDDDDDDRYGDAARGPSESAGDDAGRRRSRGGGRGDARIPGRDYVVGESALAQRDTLALMQPVVAGEVAESGAGAGDAWEAMERLWEWTLYQELDVDPEADALPVLLTDVPRASRRSREQMCKIMFETFKVKGFYVAPQPVLSLFASGRTNGLSVESGAGVTHALPVFEGYALRHASMRSEAAGSTVDARLSRMLAERGRKFGRAQAHLVRALKEQRCAVALAFAAEVERAGVGSNAAQEHELPDGTVVQLDERCRLEAAEALFDPSLLQAGDAGSAGPTQSGPARGHAGLAWTSLAQCDADLQRTLRSAVVVSGGTSMLPGYARRMQAELDEKTGAEGKGTADQERPEDAPKTGEGGPAVVLADSRRKHAAWIGGSMLASLSTFASMRITKQEYDDVHEGIVHRKCF